MSSLKKIQYCIKKRWLTWQCQEIVSQLNIILRDYEKTIPVFIVAYNNGKYVKNIVIQLNELKIKPIIFNNASTDKNTIDTLNEINLSGNANLINSNKNWGHLIGFLEPIYKVLPNFFAYSDPDLKLNTNLDHRFLRVLADLTKQYNVFKAGFALNLLPNEIIANGTHKILRRKPIFFEKTFSIREWEAQFWRTQLSHSQLEIYSAAIDTTFAVYNKSNYAGDFFDAVRVAGNYQAIHLPWFPNLDIITNEDKKKYLQDNLSTTWVK